MFELLFKSISEKVAISETELALCKKFFIYKALRKKQYFLQQDNICEYTAFVIKGVLKAYTVNEKGVEHIVQFASEGWWIADLYSFYTREPSTYNIDALEDSQLLLMRRDAYDTMLNDIPKMERYFRLLLQNSVIAIQQRLTGSLSQTAEEKYRRLLDKNPGIIQRVPQHMIASYLGITPETLSRIRKQIATKI